MADDTQKLFHAAVSFVQSQFFRSCLCILVLIVRPCKSQRSQPRDGPEQSHLMFGIAMLPTPGINAQYTNQALLYTDGSHKHGTYIIGKNMSIEWQEHPIKRDNLIVSEL